MLTLTLSLLTFLFLVTSLLLLWRSNTYRMTLEAILEQLAVFNPADEELAATHGKIIHKIAHRDVGNAGCWCVEWQPKLITTGSTGILTRIKD